MLLVIFMLGLLCGTALASIVVTVSNSRKKVPLDGTWVKTRLFDDKYANKYCNKSGCVKSPLSHPIKFGMCEKHYRMYWRHEPNVVTLPAKKYESYGWMSDTN